MSNPAHSSSPESFNLTTRPITDYDFFFLVQRHSAWTLSSGSSLLKVFAECSTSLAHKNLESCLMWMTASFLHVHMMVMNGTVALAVRHTALIDFTPLLRWVTEGRKTDWQKLRTAKDKGLIWGETWLLQENTHFTNWLRIGRNVLNRHEKFRQVVILVTFGWPVT